MGPWDWVIVALVAFGVLQVLALRYALRQEPTDPDGGTNTFASGFESGEPQESRTVDGGMRQCPHCGAENVADYTYCRSCVNMLGRI